MVYKIGEKEILLDCLETCMHTLVQRLVTTSIFHITLAISYVPFLILHPPGPSSHEGNKPQENLYYNYYSYNT